MSPAKLFTVLAIVLAMVLAVWAWISTTRALGSLDFTLYSPLHDTYFVLPAPRHFLLFGTVMCAGFAALYYATTRYLRAEWIRVLVVLHFSAVVLAAILFFAAIASSHLLVASTLPQDNRATERMIRRVVTLSFLGAWSFLLSWLFFAVNLVYAVVRAVRKRYAHP